MGPVVPQLGIRTADSAVARWLRESPQYRPAPNGTYAAPILLCDSDEATLVSGAVSSWTDLSGNGYHLAQGTAARRPAWTANTVNGHASIDFTRASVHWLQNTFTQAQPADIWLVARIPMGSLVAQYILDSKTAEDTLFYWDNGDGHNLYASGGGGVLTVANAEVEGWHIYHHRWLAGNAELRIDGTSVGTHATSNNAFDGLTLGAGSAAAASPTTMKVAYLSAFGATLGAPQVAATVAYLKARYGIA